MYGFVDIPSSYRAEQPRKQSAFPDSILLFKGLMNSDFNVLLDFLVTVKAAPHECVIRTGQPYA